MSGGSSDDAVLAISHEDASGRVVLDRVLNQGQPPPFDPRRAVERFVAVLREYRVASVIGDKYGGETFTFDFQNAGISYRVSEQTKSELYEALEPLLNGGKVLLLDTPTLEQQLLGLVWRGGKIDHASGEHDDWANAAAGAICAAAQVSQLGPLDPAIVALNAAAPPPTAGVGAAFYAGNARDHSVGSLTRDAFGFGTDGGVSDLGRRAFGD